MGQPPPPPTPPAEHNLFGLRSATPAAPDIASALAQAWTVQHDLSDLGMSEADWARLFALSRG